MEHLSTLYDANGWIVNVEAEADEYGPDGDCYTERDLELHGDTWESITLHVTVDLHGRTIGDAWISGVEHGQMGGGVTADALELTPSEYGQEEDGTPYVSMGSPLSGAVVEAIDEAGKWLASVGAQVNMWPLVQRFDPHSTA